MRLKMRSERSNKRIEQTQQEGLEPLLGRLEMLECALGRLAQVAGR